MVPVTSGAPSQFVTTDQVDLTQAQFAAATMVGASLRTVAGDQVVTIELWDYGAGSWVTAGTCRAVADIIRWTFIPSRSKRPTPRAPLAPKVWAKRRCRRWRRPSAMPLPMRSAGFA